MWCCVRAGVCGVYARLNGRAVCSSLLMSGYSSAGVQVQQRKSQIVVVAVVVVVVVIMVIAVIVQLLLDGLVGVGGRLD